MFNKLSMRAKLLTIICAICAVAMLQIGLISRESLNALRTGKESQMRAATESLVDKIDRNLFERYGDVQAFALSDPARSGSPERINHFINDMMGVYTPVYDMMIVTNSKGKVISVNSVNKSGKPVDTAFMIGKDYSDRAWFQAAIKGEIKDAMTFVEDLQLDEDVAKATRGSGKVMNFTAPIKDKTTGEILGVWSNRMSWDDVVDQIKKEESEKIKSDRITEVFGYILDANGQFLIHPLGDEFALKKSFPGFEKAKVSAKEHSLIEHVDLKSSFFSGEVIQVISPSKGYGSYPGKGWYSILQVPATDSQFDYTTRMIFFSILFQIVGMLTAFFIIRGLVTVFSNVASQLRMEANQVSSASANISSASRNLAQATGQQASALQETAASIEEMNAMVKKSSENANRSRDVAQTSHEVATKGKQAVEQMVGAITEIDTSNASIMRQVEESNRQISEIVKVITEIGNKTKVINDIVFQTKLLSFNASVEAARAGEHGKGFAVVAEEVGNLAQMSGNAAKEISDMLNGSISKVESIVNDTKVKVERLIAEGKSKVESGTVVAKQCGEILEEVVKNVSEVNSMIGEISTASHEQAQGISEITKAMNQMDQVTHSNAATSQEAASSSQQLSSQSESLLRVVKTLDSTINGASYIHTESPDSSPPDSDRKNKGNGAKVIQLSERRKHHASNSETPKKSVALADSVPSEDDPRFKEV